MVYITTLLLFYYKTLSQCDYNDSTYPFYSMCKPGRSYCHNKNSTTYQDFSSFCFYTNEEDKRISFLYDKIDNNSKKICKIDVESYPNHLFGDILNPDIIEAYFIRYSCKKGYYIDTNGLYESSSTCVGGNFNISPCIETCTKPNIPNAIFIGENPDYIFKNGTYKIRCPPDMIFNAEGDNIVKNLQCIGVNDLSNYPIACIDDMTIACLSVKISKSGKDYVIEKSDRTHRGDAFINGAGIVAPEFFSWDENKQVDIAHISCDDKPMKKVTLELFKIICQLFKIEKNGNENKIEYSEITDTDLFNDKPGKFSGNITVTALDGFLVNGKKSLTVSCLYNRHNEAKADPSNLIVIDLKCPITNLNCTQLYNKRLMIGLIVIFSIIVIIVAMAIFFCKFKQKLCFKKTEIFS